MNPHLSPKSRGLARRLRAGSLLAAMASLAACLAMASTPGSARADSPPVRPPNFVVIVADDLGWGELMTSGPDRIPTPRLDALADEGIRFSSGYVSCPVCSPTRAGLLTGRYQQRFGHEFNGGPVESASDDFGLPLDEKTLPQRLKASGYATGMVGKWHLGFQPEMHPLARGFDEFYGFLSGAHPYLPDSRRDARSDILRGREPVEPPADLTREFGKEASAFIERHASAPFFLYLTYNAVHTPLEAVESDLARFESIEDRKRRTFAAMLSAMDESVGGVLDTLRAKGLDENTLVIFVSDNGGPTPATTASNGPLRGFKGQVWEGGVRVPFFVRWTGRVAGGRTIDTPAIAIDIAATCLAAAGSADRLDPLLEGRDLLDLIHPGASSSEAGGDAKAERALFWRFGEQWAVRRGDWKLVHAGTSRPGSEDGEGDADGAKPMLFDLKGDIGEQHDRAATEPAVVAELQAAFDAWNAGNIPPKWRRGDKARERAERRAR